MKVSFNGFNENSLTFMCEEEIAKGYPVKITANHTVAKCDDGDAFIGLCFDGDNENAVVQMSGHVKMTYSGTAPALGKTELACAADGSVKENAGGTVCTVVAVNTTDTTVEFLF